MDKNRVNIATEFVGAMPMIAEYLKRIKLAENIDDLVQPLRSNHRRLSHGNTCFIMVLYLICRPHVMYKVEEWVRDTTYLKVIFPEIEPSHLSDDKYARDDKTIEDEKKLCGYFVLATNKPVKELSMEKALLRTLKDGNGNYLWNFSNDTIFGKPVLTSLHMPTIASGKKIIVFGDLSYYWLIERQPLTIKCLSELYLNVGQIGFSAFERVDGKLIRPEAVKVLKQAE